MKYKNWILICICCLVGCRDASKSDSMPDERESHKFGASPQDGDSDILDTNMMEGRSGSSDATERLQDLKHVEVFELRNGNSAPIVVSLPIGKQVLQLISDAPLVDPEESTGTFPIPAMWRIKFRFDEDVQMDVSIVSDGTAWLFNKDGGELRHISDIIDELNDLLIQYEVKISITPDNDVFDLSQLVRAEIKYSDQESWQQMNVGKSKEILEKVLDSPSLKSGSIKSLTENESGKQLCSVKFTFDEDYCVTAAIYDSHTLIFDDVRAESFAVKAKTFLPID